MQVVVCCFTACQGAFLFCFYSCWLAVPGLGGEGGGRRAISDWVAPPLPTPAANQSAVAMRVGLWALLGILPLG